MTGVGKVKNPIHGQELFWGAVNRVFEKMRGKRWICCTFHVVQKHCSREDLTAEYDAVYRLARGKV